MPGGRPTRMTEVTEVTVDGQLVRMSIAEAILHLLRVGNYLETACWAVGIAPRTVQLWMAEGAKALDRIDAGVPRRELGAHGRRCAVFFRAVRAAQATSETADLRRLQLLADGGLPVTKVTEKRELVYPEDGGDPVERVVERTTTTSFTAPNVRALTWRLERKFPDRWGPTPADLDAEEADDEFGEDPIQTMNQMLLDIARRNTETMAELEAAGLEDILDAEVVDEKPPEIEP